MNKNINASQAKNNFGTLIDEVYVKGNTVTILKNNKAVAKLVPIEKKLIEDNTSGFLLNDKEYKEIKKGMKEFRDSFKFSF